MSAADASTSAAPPPIKSCTDEISVGDQICDVYGSDHRVGWCRRCTFEECREQVASLLEGRVLVGHGRASDLRA